MIYDCNRLNVQKSERRIVETITDIINEYYESCGYHIFEPTYGIKDYFSHKCIRNKIIDLLIGAKYIHDGSFSICTTDNYQIDIECFTPESLELNKGLCMALNNDMPSGIDWSLNIIDDVSALKA